MQESNRKSLLLRMPVLPLRGMMVFPHMVLHFDVGRPTSVAALEKAMMGDQRIFLVAQMDAEIDEPELSDLCRVGTIAQIKQVLNLPGDSIRVLVEGVRRGVLGTVLEEDPCLIATVRLVREDAAPDTAEMKALVAAAKADGHIDAREREVIEGEFSRIGTDGELQQWLHAELEKPLDPAEVARAGSTPEIASEMYLASLMVADEQNFMERAYLDELAKQLRLEPSLKAQLERQLAQPQPPALP